MKKSQIKKIKWFRNIYIFKNYENTYVCSYLFFVTILFKDVLAKLPSAFWVALTSKGGVGNSQF